MIASAGLTFGPDGNLYIVNWGTSSVTRYQGPSGTTPGAPMPSPGNSGADFIPDDGGRFRVGGGLIFGPDGNGDGHQDLYVTYSDWTGTWKANHGTVRRYDGVTGAFIDAFVTPDSGGLNDPYFLTFTETDPVTLAYTGGSLTAAATAVAPVHEILSADRVQPPLTEVLAPWHAWHRAGVDTSSLGGIDIKIADLGGATLGEAVGHTIWLDANAAGWGWFVDPTPWDDSEFTTPGNQGEQNNIDLLTVRWTDMMPPFLSAYEHPLEEGVSLPGNGLDGYFSALALGVFKAGG